MKKTTLFISVFLITVLFSQTSTAQITKTSKKKPAVLIELNGGYGLSLMDLRGDADGFWSFGNYGTSNGINGGLTVKVGVKTYKLAQLRPYITFGYAQFSGEKDNRAHNPDGFIPGNWPKTGFTGQTTYTPVDTTGTSEVLMRMPYVGLGFEVAQYTDRKNLSSFNFGLDLTMSFIFGKVTETHTYAIPGIAGAGDEVSYTMRSNVRFGVGLNAVFNQRIENSPIGFNIGTRFQLYNILGKSVETANSNGEFFLMDGSDKNTNSLLNDSRTMSSLNFFGGISFYIGRK